MFGVGEGGAGAIATGAGAGGARRGGACTATLVPVSSASDFAWTTVGSDAFSRCLACAGGAAGGGTISSFFSDGAACCDGGCVNFGIPSTLVVNTTLGVT